MESATRMAAVAHMSAGAVDVHRRRPTGDRAQERVGVVVVSMMTCPGSLGKGQSTKSISTLVLHI